MPDPITCDRCGRALEAVRADIDDWVVIDAGEDGWTQILCVGCQTDRAREVTMLLLDG